jgi:hypothetical protein
MYGTVGCPSRWTHYRAIGSSCWSDSRADGGHYSDSATRRPAKIRRGLAVGVTPGQASGGGVRTGCEFACLTGWWLQSWKRGRTRGWAGCGRRSEPLSDGGGAREAKKKPRSVLPAFRKPITGRERGFNKKLASRPIAGTRSNDLHGIYEPRLAGWQIDFVNIVGRLSGNGTALRQG